MAYLPTCIRKSQQNVDKCTYNRPMNPVGFSQNISPRKINMEHVLMEVWFRSFSFLFMGDGCRFQPFIFQGVKTKRPRSSNSSCFPQLHFPRLKEQLCVLPRSEQFVNEVTVREGCCYGGLPPPKMDRWTQKGTILKGKSPTNDV